MWVFLGILSAFFLGFYDVFKKLSLRENAVLPVLFYACLSGALVFFPVWIMSLLEILEPGSMFYVSHVNTHTHFLIFLKSSLVLSSWIFAYFAFKHLPVTIVSPIRTSAPLWTLLGAMLLFGERLGMLQWIGILLTVVFYYLFSIAGKKEGIHFRSNRWIWFITAATLLGSASSLYDKYLMRHFDRMAVQAYYTFYMVLILVPLLLIFWIPIRKGHTAFQWRWSIPLIGITLSVADFMYFYALTDTESMISILSSLRRSSVMVSFLLSILLFREKNVRVKFLILLGIMAGIGLIILGSVH
jgi:bacterial/archaeal transporter family protein